VTRSSGRRERLVTGYAGRVSIALAVGWLATQLGRRILSPLLPAIVEDLALSPGEAGFALSVSWGLYALTQYPSGRAADALSRWTVLVPGTTLTAVGFAVVGRATGYALLLVGAGLIGVGAGLLSVPTRALLSDLYVQRRAQAFGLNEGAGRAGNVVAAGLAILVLATATWRLAFLPVVVLLGIVAVALHRLADGPYVIERVSLTPRRAFGRVLGTWELRRLVVVYSLFVFGFEGVVGFLPTFLQATKSFSPTAASAGFGVVFAVGSVATVLTGRVADRVGTRPVAAGTLVVGALGVALLVLAGSLPGIVAGLVVFAAGLMGFPPVVQTLLMDRFRDGNLGSEFGAFKTLYMLVGSLGPGFVGVVADWASYPVAFGCIFACFLVALAVLLRPVVTARIGR